MAVPPGRSQQISDGTHICVEGAHYYYLDAGTLYRDVVSTNQLDNYPPTPNDVAHDVSDYRLVRLTGAGPRIVAAFTTTTDPGELRAADDGTNLVLSEQCAQLLASCEEEEGQAFVLCQTPDGKLLDVGVQVSGEQVVPSPTPTTPIDCAAGHVVYADTDGALVHLVRQERTWSVADGLGELTPAGTRVSQLRMLVAPLRVFAMVTGTAAPAVRVARHDVRGNWKTRTVIEMPSMTTFDTADVNGREEAVVVVRVSEGSQSSLYMTRQLDLSLDSWSPPEKLVGEVGLPYQ
jgi:hypothetical protein